jgi:hypothetical protein
VPGRVNGFSLAYTAVGAVVMWSGIKGETISDTFRGLLKGQAPQSNQEPITGSAESSASTSTGSGPGGLFGAIGNVAGGDFSQSSVEKLWTANGGPSDTAAFAAAVAMAESGGSSTVTSSNPDGGTNVGLFQLDTKGVGAGYSVAQLQNPNLNTQITVMATNGGTDWTEWGDPVTAAVGYHYTPGGPIP